MSASAALINGVGEAHETGRGKSRYSDTDNGGFFLHVTSKAPIVPRRHLASIFRSDGKTGLQSYFITVRQFGTIYLFSSLNQSTAALLSAYRLDCVLV